MINETTDITENGRRLTALENLEEWKVEEDSCDIRGWDLFANGEKVGTVENLIADTVAERIQYVEVAIDEHINQYRNNSYRKHIHRDYHVLYGDDQSNRMIVVPIGMIAIDEENKKVLSSPNLTAVHFSNAPRYSGFSVTPLTPIQEVLTIKHYADQDENYRDDFSKDDYDMSEYRAYPTISDRFYDSDFFSRKRYLSRYNNGSTTMSGFQTGMPRR